MNPHTLLDRLDEVSSYVQRGETAAATYALHRLQDDVRREAVEMDAWADREEYRNHV
jgi:hypothetical protein